MANIRKVVTPEQLMRRFKHQRKVQQQRMVEGLTLAALFVQRNSQQLVPVEFGNLKASAFTRAMGEGWDTYLVVGYTAFYAPFVHESVGMVLKGEPREPSPPHIGNYWDPAGRGQAKFLEAVIRKDAKQVREIFASHMKIK